MNWRRIQSDGDQKTRKEWRAERGRYRIVWRNAVQGITVDPGYHAAVREFVSSTGRSMWERVDRNRSSLYRTFNAAKASCEKHLASRGNNT